MVDLSPKKNKKLTPEAGFERKIWRLSATSTGKADHDKKLPGTSPPDALKNLGLGQRFFSFCFGFWVVFLV